MVELILQILLPPLLAGACFSFLLERLIEPETRWFWKRPPSSSLIHVGFYLLFFVFELVLFQRPWFAVANVLTLQFFLVLVNNAKYQSLKEPFVCQDFEYFTDALKHPRLYVPFFGLKKSLLAASCFLTALIGGLKLEPSMIELVSVADFLFILLLLTLVGSFSILLGGRRKMIINFNPVADLNLFGQLTFLYLYGLAERKPCRLETPGSFVRSAENLPSPLPHLVVVQSESFFDIRPLFQGIRPEILAEFDSLKKAALSHGRLDVPAWGANTVRTEFGFLSGLTEDSLGVHRFNPYRKFARQELASLPSYLQKLGYRTVCVHPYPVSFYSRDQVFPFLGFDDFLDIGSFSAQGKCGPYMGDFTVGETASTLVGEVGSRPLFLFVITMENHGPLHLEKVHAGDRERLYSSPPPSGCDELTIYLRHLRNSDRMAGLLRNSLDQLTRPAFLGWFGDHVPIMPEVYRRLGEPDGRTDYFFWTNTGATSGGVHLDTEVENLGSFFLKSMGLAAPSE